MKISKKMTYKKWEEIEDDVSALIWELMLGRVYSGKTAIEITPDGKVSLWYTFSGDNSYFPGDTSIYILRDESSEYTSHEDLGIDEDGAFHDSEDFAYIMDQAEDEYEEALVEKALGENK